MRITFVLPTYSPTPSGGFAVVYRLAAGLANRDHEIIVLHPTTPLRRPRFAAPVEARRRLRRTFNRVTGAGPAEWAQVPSNVRMRYVSRLSPSSFPDADIIVATAWETAAPVLEAGPRAGRPVYFIQSDEAQWSPEPTAAHATWFLPMPKAVIARWLVERAAELGAEDVTHIPLAVDHDLFHVTKSIEDRRPRVAMLASEHPVKRTRIGIEVLCRVHELVPEMTGALFGVLPAGLSLPPYLNFVGALRPAEVAALLNDAAAYLCTSAVEGWHLPPAEAMACGACVVSTDIGGVADYAISGTSALLAPVDDAEALADNLVRALTDQNLRQRIAVAGHALMSQFTWPATVVKFEEWVASAMTC